MPSGGGPSRAELAQALTRAGPERIAASDLRSIDCDRRLADGYACRWQQHVGGDWRPRSGQLGVDGAGWRLIPRVPSDGAA